MIILNSHKNKFNNNKIKINNKANKYNNNRYL